jgi:hypothetical protein
MDGARGEGVRKAACAVEIGPTIEVNGWFQHEHWVAPTYLTGMQSDNTVTVQVTFFPKLRTKEP